MRQTAVLVFDQLRKGPAKLVISWWPDNWQIDAKDFELSFRIP